MVEDNSGDKLHYIIDGFTGETYSMMEFNRHYSSSDRAEIRRKVDMIKTLEHPNLVKCLELFEIGENIYLLLKHIDGGSLNGSDVMVESALAKVGRLVISCLSYLHGNKITHGDIKPSNIFVSSELQVKVLYLGKVLSQAQVMRDFGGIHDEVSWDVWNVALSIRTLYKDSSYPLGKPTQKPSKELVAFLVCCMQTDLSKRWTAEELIDHPFVTGVQWNV